MSSISPTRQRYIAKHNELCISNVGDQTQMNAISTHFQQFGHIIRLNFTSSTGGFVFLGYEHPSMVDQCMASRPHTVNGRPLYIKRALPNDDEHPRERFDLTSELMIVIDFDENISRNKQFLIDLQSYFSTYGQMQDCEYRDEKHFSFIFIQFTDYDEVDRIILDKPHYYHDHPLDVMKYIKSNVDLMNIKYESRQRSMGNLQKSIDYSSRSVKSSDGEIKRETLNEGDLQKEVFRLQNTLTQLGEEFELQRRELDVDCEEQLKKTKENVDQTRRLQEDLQQENARLSTEYESMKADNNTLNENYLSVELENFEIGSYYEQILAEEKAKTTRLEAAYHDKLKAKDANTSSLPKSQ